MFSFAVGGSREIQERLQRSIDEAKARELRKAAEAANRAELFVSPVDDVLVAAMNKAAKFLSAEEIGELQTLSRHQILTLSETPEAVSDFLKIPVESRRQALTTAQNPAFLRRMKIDFQSALRMFHV
jgi:hypothetical protein